MGPRPVPRKQLIASRLAAAIQQAVRDEEVKNRAAQLGQRLRAGRGVENAVALIEAFARDGRFSK